MSNDRIAREGTIRLQFDYAAGDVAGRAVAAARDQKRLLGSRCERCDRVLAPARSLCPGCGHATSELSEIGPGGTVESWTAVPGTGVFVLVRPDGADTAITHRLAGAGAGEGDSRNPRIGGRVTAVFDYAGLAGFEVVES
ncbi:MAG: zinc ribbon domain-containing protein [Candidatus Nanopelagicales bacterium]|nr:zinc ribbon domain-containing protein [Candidatus Nanopelagicales bacterium]